MTPNLPEVRGTKEERERACLTYFAALAALEAVRNGGTGSEALAKEKEAAAWARVKELIPEAYCR